MDSAKDIIVKPIKSSAANDVVRRVHYREKWLIIVLFILACF